MDNPWNERYNTTEFIYGKEPNVFFAENLMKLSAGKILLPAEGEGRNAVFAAKNSWQVTAFDGSEIAKEKALKLASDNNVKINYTCNYYENFEFNENYFDAIGLVFCHINSEKRKIIHNKFLKFLKKDGYIILQAYSKNQLKNKTGGPMDLDLLYSVDDIKADFEEMEILFLEENTINLSEGSYHVGQGSVVSFVGKKKK